MYIITIQNNIFRDEPELLFGRQTYKMKDQQVKNEVVNEEREEVMCWALLELESSK